jgi:molybdenum cofactor biosynthesis enzyme MoaA
MGQYTRRWLPPIPPAKLSARQRTFVGIIDDNARRPPIGGHPVATLHDALASWNLDCIIIATDTHQCAMRQRLEACRSAGELPPTVAIDMPSSEAAPADPDPNAELDRPIRNSRGQDMSMSVRRFNQARFRLHPSTRCAPDALCFAPATSLDCSPNGLVSVCNHRFEVLGRIQDTPLLELFNGAENAALREQMRDYRLDEDACRHCARQIRSGQPQFAFSVTKYDAYSDAPRNLAHPVHLTLRLGKTCNLACIMCTGEFSSRIRAERENLPPEPSPYTDAFFDAIRGFLPKVRWIEFLGGEPFLIKGHERVLDMIAQTDSRCGIYVNTNATVLTPKIRRYLEELNFVTVAISMDAVSPALHAKLRCGIDHKAFLRNLQWYLDLRERKPVEVILNATETRHNWYELPRLFEFAAAKRCRLHVNTCVHPTDCTLYDLPTAELAYVADYLERMRPDFAQDALAAQLRRSYDYLQALVGDELGGRAKGIQRAKTASAVPATDGLLAVPLFFDPPFDTPAAVRRELDRMADFGVSAYRERFLSGVRSAIRDTKTDLFDDVARDPARQPLRAAVRGRRRKPRR